MILFFFALLSSSAHAEILNPAFAKSIDTCKTAKPSAHVWFFKQWHLGPKLDTTDIKKSLSLPQEANQRAIFEQLDSWISSRKLKIIIAEGCGSGEMTEATALKFNGWDVTGLKSQSTKADYDSILSSVPLKLEAKYGSKIHVVCGDDEELAKKNALAFSDARGELGYLTRLEQYKNDPSKAADYLEDVVKLYHLPADTTVAQGISKLRSELKTSIDQVQQFIQKRNEHLVEVAAKVAQSKTSSDDIAIVFGGAHAEGVKTLLEGKLLTCDIVEPAGYPTDDRDEAKMIKRLKELLFSSHD
jgi:hypothetical protein